MKSPLYWNSFLYDLIIRWIYRRPTPLLQKQWEAVCAWIPQNEQVLEIAAGSGRFYFEALSRITRNYAAIDMNPSFVRNLQRKGVSAVVGDIRSHPVPVSGTIIMISALYHFRCDEESFLGKLLGSARKRLILVEPVSTKLTTHAWKDRLKARLIDMGEGPIFDRYSNEELLSLCNRAGHVEHHAALDGGDYLVVLQGKAQRRS